MRSNPPSNLNETEILKILRDEVDRAGSQAAWARRAGIARPFVVEVLTGKKGVGRKILKALDIKTIYRQQNQTLEARDIIQLLQAEIGRAGGQSAWALKANIDRTHLNKVLKGRRNLGPKMLKILHVKKVFVREGH